jgi:hypothetical protein
MTAAEVDGQAAELGGAALAMGTGGEAAELGAVVESGRYRVFQADGGLVLARAVDTCERCQGCGCGQQAEPIALPDPRRGRAHLIGWLTSNANRGIMASISRAMRNDGD